MIGIGGFQVNGILLKPQTNLLTFAVGGSSVTTPLYIMHSKNTLSNVTINKITTTINYNWRK